MKGIPSLQSDQDHHQENVDPQPAEREVGSPAQGLPSKARSMRPWRMSVAIGRFDVLHGYVFRRSFGVRRSNQILNTTYHYEDS